MKKTLAKRLNTARAHSMDGIQSMKGRLSRNSSARDLSHVNPDAPDLEQPSTGPPSTPVASCSTDRVPAEQVGTWESYSYPKAVPPPIFKPLDLVDPLNDIFCGYKRSGKKKLPKFLDSHSQIIQEVEFRGTLVQVEEIPTENVIGRRLRVTLNDRAVRSERKAFHYSIGDISMTSGLRGSNKKGVKGALSGAGGVAKDWAKAKLAQDSFIKPEYFGNGVVYFETTWAYLYILSCGLHDNLIIENGCWYASDSTISVDLHVESNIVTGLLGGGFTETRLKGEGWVVIKLPVPFSELHRVQLEDTEVRISEGQIVLLRRGNITHRVKKATKSVAAMKATGEGIVQSFKGTGEVWIMPTVMLKEMLEKRKGGGDGSGIGGAVLSMLGSS